MCWSEPAVLAGARPCTSAAPSSKSRSRTGRSTRAPLPHRTAAPIKDTKVAIGAAVLAFAGDRGVVLVILQPTVVYGPKGSINFGGWTVSLPPASNTASLLVGRQALIFSSCLSLWTPRRWPLPGLVTIVRFHDFFCARTTSEIALRLYKPRRCHVSGTTRLQ